MKLEEVINNNYSNLNENDLYILKYVCNNKKECRKLTINELGNKCNVSRTTILRFAQKLGFKGYSEFKVFLRWEEDEDEKKKELDEDYVEKFYLDFEDTKKNLNKKKLLEVCKLIHNANRVFVYGTGMTQTAVAKEMQRIFLLISKYFYVIEGEAELKTIVSDIKQNDIVIIISLYGNSEFLQEIATKLNINGTKYISITKFVDNILARNTTYNIYISTTPVNIDKGRVHEGTVLFFLLLDILFREYLNYIRSIEVFK